MPYRRKRRRTYKKRPYKKRRAARKRAYVAKKRRQRSYAMNRLKGRSLPYHRIFTLPGTSRNQTIQYSVINESEYNVYFEPNDFTASTKVDRVTNFIYPSFIGGVNNNLQICFENLQTPPVMQDFVTLRKMFAWTRFKWIRVTLIPEDYQAVSTGEATIGDTPTHPTLCVINDNGEAAQTLGPDSNYSIDDARTLAKHSYSEHYFNRPHRFYVNSVQMNQLTGTSAAKNIQPYASYKRWVGPSNNIGQDGTQLIPNDNFYYGFTNIPDGFKFAVKLEACVVAKHLRIADFPASFSTPANASPATNQEEKKPDKGGGAQ